MAQTFEDDFTRALQPASTQHRSVPIDTWLSTWRVTSPKARPLFALVPSPWVHELRKAGVLVPWPFSLRTARNHHSAQRSFNVHQGRLYGLPIAAQTWGLFASRKTLASIGESPPEHWQDLARISRKSLRDRSGHTGFDIRFDPTQIDRFGLYMSCDAQHTLTFAQSAGVRVWDSKNDVLEASLYDLTHTFESIQDLRSAWGVHATWLDRASPQIWAQELTADRLSLLLTSSDLLTAFATPQDRARILIAPWPLIDERRDVYTPISGWSWVLTQEGVDASWLSKLAFAINSPLAQAVRANERGVLPTYEKLPTPLSRPLKAAQYLLLRGRIAPPWGTSGDSVRSLQEIAESLCAGNTEPSTAAERLLTDWRMSLERP